jgi:hypothetical protein
VTLWEHGVTVQDLITTMNCYDLEGHFLDYVFKKTTGIIRELQAYIPTSQDISLVTRNLFSNFIENIKKELATMGGAYHLLNLNLLMES